MNLSVESISIAPVKNQTIDLESQTFSNQSQHTEVLAPYFKRKFSHLNNIEEILRVVQQASYLPKEELRSNSLLKDPLRLYYLTTFDTGMRKSPFTAKQVEIFKVSRKADSLTSACFKVAILPFTFISATSYIAFINITQLSPAGQAAISGSVGLVASLAINMLSLCITGTIPHCSKTKDNQKQNTIQRVKEIYDEMAYELMDLYQTNSEFACLLARNIHIPCLIESATNQYLDEKEAKFIFRLLKQAVAYLRKETEIPRSHKLRPFMLN